VGHCLRCPLAILAISMTPLSNGVFRLQKELCTHHLLTNVDSSVDPSN
jgi:hypothetical protein